MGKMLVTFHQAGQNGRVKNTDKALASMPVARLKGAVTEQVTTSATSAKTVYAAPQGTNGLYDTTDGGFVTVSPIGVNIYVVSGPTAGLTAAVPAAGANGAGFPVLNGQQITFAVDVGDVVAGVEFS